MIHDQIIHDIDIPDLHDTEIDIVIRWKDRSLGENSEDDPSEWLDQIKNQLQEQIEDCLTDQNKVSQKYELISHIEICIQLWLDKHIEQYKQDYGIVLFEIYPKSVKKISNLS